MKTKSRNKQLYLIALLSLFLLITAVTIGYADPSGEKWAFQTIEHNNDGWLVAGGVTTLYDDGTGTTTYNYNSNGSTGSNTENFTYSITPNPDGSMTMTNIFSDRTQISRCVVSNNNKMIICDGTEDTNKQTLQINIKMDGSKTYTNADFIGDYYVIEYDYDSIGSDWPGHYVADSAIAITDGNGNVSQTHPGMVTGKLEMVRGLNLML
ncbi:MAG: hypothetical protein HZB30_03115 [Nitrospirae bacterium]|nr:hypothetical protein [Nitrospirota bacterium]